MTLEKSQLVLERFQETIRRSLMTLEITQMESEGSELAPEMLKIAFKVIEQPYK